MRRILALGVVAAVACGVCAADEPKPREKPKYEYREEHDPNGIGKFYLGRRSRTSWGTGRPGGSSGRSGPRRRTRRS
jgi:hypothetical protein